MADDKRFALPGDPDVRLAAGIVIGAVVLLVVIAHVFRDVQPA